MIKKSTIVFFTIPTFPSSNLGISRVEGVGGEVLGTKLEWAVFYDLSLCQGVS